MISSMWIRRAVAVAAVAATTAGVVPASFSGGPTVSAAPACDLGALGSGGEFHALTPERIFDSRTGLGTTAGKKATTPEEADESKVFDIDVLGEGGIPENADDVLAVVLNVTVTASSNAGFLSLYPKGFDTNGGLNTSSLVNFTGSGAVPNVAVVSVGVGGSLSANVTTPAANGSAHVIVDVFGWISKTAYVDTDDSGARLVPVTPGRILDTRGSSGVSAGETIELQILGADTIDGGVTDIVPDRSSVTGVMVNLTAVNRLPASAGTFVAITPDPAPSGTAPGTSNTNVPSQRVKASLAIVPVGADGKVHLYNAEGTTHLLVDVLAYLESGFEEASREGRVVPLEAPFRVFDTREAEFNNVPLATGSFEPWSFKAFAESVTLNGTCIGDQSALLGNMTAANLKQLPGFGSLIAESFLTAYPADASRPETSNLNMIQGESVANTSLLKYGSDDGDDYVINVYNEYGDVHYLLDVFAVVL